MTRPYISLIYPAYNEASTIRDTVNKTIEYFSGHGLTYEIIVAADGNDGTREVVREMTATNPRLQVIGASQRRGKGRGVREAVAIAQGEIIGYADADYKVPIEEFDKIEFWLKSGYHVVIGSRGLQQSFIERKQPLYRRLGSWFFRSFMRTVVGLHSITDSQCGFKFFPRVVALNLFERQRIDGYMFDVEILALAQFLGYQIKEVGIHWRDDGDSRLQLLSGNMRNVIDIFRIRLSRRTCQDVPVEAQVKAGEDA